MKRCPCVCTQVHASLAEMARNKNGVSGLQGAHNGVCVCPRSFARATMKVKNWFL